MLLVTGKLQCFLYDDGKAQSNVASLTRRAALGHTLTSLLIILAHGQPCSWLPLTPLLLTFAFPHACL